MMLHDAMTADYYYMGADGRWDGVSPEENKFVSEWTTRINYYLSGSPTAGTGIYYAKAAYKYGVDPRVGPAISCNESGKGKACWYPYNA